MPTYRIQLRRDTAANFQSSNPNIAEGEVVIDTTAQEAGTPFFKIGEGESYTATDFAAPALVNPTSGTNNYAPIASPTFTGTAKAPDLTVEDTNTNDPTLTVQTTDETGTTVIKHDSINCSGGITGEAITGTSLSITASAHGGSHLVPTGTILPFAGTAAPTGYALCDGDDLNTFTFKDLHAVVSNNFGGTAYSAGVTDQSGVSTTFKLPDLRGRVIAGHNKMDSSDNDVSGSSSSLLLTSNRDRTVTKHEYTGVQNMVIDVHQAELPLPGDILLASDGTQGTVSTSSAADISSSLISESILKRCTIVLEAGSNLSEASEYTLRTVVGVDGDTFAASGGDDTHLLNINEMPAHTHGQPRHTNTMPGGPGGSNKNKDRAAEDLTDATGGSLPHNIVQPTMILNYMIKT
jgi:microcystin-dependent protein